MAEKHRRWRGLAYAAAPVAVAFGLYFGTFDAPFLYDDTIYVVENTQIRSVSNAPRMWITPYHEGGLYRPLTATSYLVDHFLAGLDPRQFHRSNVFFYLLSVLLFFGVVRELGGDQREAGIASLIFAIHPIHTEAVAWVVGRAEILSGLLSFAAVIAWSRFRKGRQGRYLTLTCAAYFLALGAKENAASLPAVLLLGELLGLFGPAATRDKRTPRSAAARVAPLLWHFAGLGAVLASYLLLRTAALGGFGIQQELLAFSGDSPQTRWASVLVGIGHSIRLCVLPLELRIEYSDLKVASLIDWRVLLSLVAIGALAFAAVQARRSAPRVTFWIGWFALFLLPVSNLVVEIGAFIAERFLFLPSAGACALAAMALSRAFVRRKPPWIRVLAAGAAVVLFASSASLTVARNRDWLDPERFWRKALAQAPSTEKPYLNLGTLLWKLGKERGDASLQEEADEILESGVALQRDSSRKVTNNHVIMIQNLANHHRERGGFEDAIRYYERIAPLIEEYPALFPDAGASLLVNYGVALEKAGRVEEALLIYEGAIATKQEKHLAGALMNAGNALRRLGEPEAAAQRFRRAIEVDPSFGIAYFSLAVTLFDLHRSHAEAFQLLGDAKRLGVPRVDVAARARAQEILDEALRARDYRMAQQTLQALATVVEPTAEDAYSQGVLAERLDEPERARDHYRRALTLDPSHARATAGLAGLD